jgi:plasmid stabilization system protein ParE
MSRYVLSTEAQEDLREIRGYLTNRGGTRIARYVLSALVTAFRRLAKTPHIGHARQDLTVADEVRFWPVFSYLIVYRRNSRPLGIVGIIHGKRDVSAVLRERL